MNDPLLTLIIGLVVVGAAALVFWPQSGFLARWKQIKKDRRKILLEDALKHLYHCEYRRLSCTLQSIAGALSIDSDRAAEVLMLLEQLELLHSRENEFHLTPEGRRYALRIVRVHRLWESYLAERTGVHETEWHRQAEKLEHVLSPDEADVLASKIGNPAYDPHGDPIPSASGAIPVKKGSALNQAPEGQPLKIVHLEDEPDMVYAQLVALGLHPGMVIRTLEKSRERIRFEADGEEVVLAPIAALNVTVVPLPDDHVMEGPFRTLADLGPNETGEVVRISGACRGLQRRRLMDLGVVPGTLIRNHMESVSKDPVAYEIRGAQIALRRDQARMVHIKEKTEV